MGVNQPIYVDVQIGADETSAYWTILAEQRGFIAALTLNSFDDQGTTAAGKIYPVTSVIRSFGSGISAGPSFTIKENGNVGIGTSSPTEKLQVNGNIIASNPTAANHVATKDYVDSKASGFSTCQVVSATNSVSCAPTWTLTGGGCRFYHTLLSNTLFWEDSYPTENTWNCLMKSKGSYDPWYGTATAYAICCQ